MNQSKTYHTRKKFYKKKVNNKYRKPQQSKPKQDSGPLSDDEKKLLCYIKEKIKNRSLKSFGSGYLGLHCRSHVGPDLKWTATHARVILKKLGKRKIIDLEDAQPRPSYEFKVRFRQNRKTQKSSKNYVDNRSIPNRYSPR